MSAPDDSIPGQPRYTYTFPPFPAPLPGVELIPFASYKERGISVEPGPDNVEVDILGVPTVPLPRSHEMDECKTNTQRKFLATERAKKPKNSSTRTWYEQWDEHEYNRFAAGVNPQDTPTERLRAAARNFVDGRPWPITYASETGPRYIWDKFERYAGLAEGINPPKAKLRRKAISQPDSDSDDDMADAATPTDTQANEPTTGIYLDNDAKATLQFQKRLEEREHRTEAFLDDPERQTKIFLSSYARQQGFIWADANLDCMPRVLRYFFQFLIRCKIVATLEPQLKRCIAITDIALVELPKTASMSRTLPGVLGDALSVAFRTTDTMFEYSFPSMSTEEPNDQGWNAQEQQTSPDDPTTSPDTHGWGQAPAADSNQASGWGPSDGCATSTGWGASGGWGNVDDQGGRLQRVDIEDPPAQDPPAQDPPRPEEPSEDAAPSIFAFFGPTALPVTHSTGIMERSVRRIASILPPNTNPPPLPSLDEGAGPSADAVETRLDTNCFKVILTPIPDWNAAGEFVYERPTILPKSVGPVVDEKIPSTELSPDGQAPHDPLKQDIAILVGQDEPCLEHLHVGMALAGTFVQLARMSMDNGAKKKKKKSKSAKKATTSGFWYMSNLTFVVPSYWTVEGA